MENKQQAGVWVKAKPEFKDDCILITASKIRDEWEYTLFQIKKSDGFNDNEEPAWYWGIFCDGGEEWGDIADLKADLYFTMPLLSDKPKQPTPINQDEDLWEDVYNTMVVKIETETCYDILTVVKELKSKYSIQLKSSPSQK